MGYAAALTAAAWLVLGAAGAVPFPAVPSVGPSGPIPVGAAGADSAAAPTKAPRNVVLIVVDALRPDHLGAYGYGRPTSPNIDRLAREGFVFENAITQGNWTLPALASIMTSLYPSVHGAVRSAAGEPDWMPKMWAGRYAPKPGGKLDESRLTLAEILRGRGYATAAFVGRGICGAAFGFSQGFSEYHEGLRKLADKKDRIVGWLDRHRGAPFFLYVHPMDAHDPFRNPARFSGRWDPDYSGPMEDVWSYLDAYAIGAKTLSPPDIFHLVARYDGALAYLDESLGVLFRELEASGLAEDTLVIVTADHGEEFSEHGKVRHGHSAYDTLLKVPLILRVPGRRGGRVHDQVRSIDILPTVLDLLGVEAPKAIQGRSLRPLLEGRSLAVETAFSEAADIGRSPRVAIVARTLEWKLVHSLDDKPDQLYRLETDPREERNLAAERPDENRALTAEIDRWERESREAAAGLPPIDTGEVPLDEATMRSLRQMGYIR